MPGGFLFSLREKFPRHVPLICYCDNVTVASSLPSRFLCPLFSTMVSEKLRQDIANAFGETVAADDKLVAECMHPFPAVAAYPLTR